MNKETGLEDLLSSSGLSTVGLSTAMCDVNYINKKILYSGQVEAPDLSSEQKQQKTSLKTSTYGARNRKMRASSISLEF